MCYFLGLMIGGILFGLASDKYGRRQALIFSILVSATTSMIGVAMTTYWSYLMLRFLCGVATEGMLMSAFMIVIEIVGMEYILWGGMMTQVRIQKMGFVLI